MQTFLTRGIALLAVLGVAALVAAGALSGVARAHEHRTAGGHELVVGFQNEPAYVNEPNGIWISVHEAAPAGAAAEGEDHHEEGAPVEGLEKTLEAEVIQGNERMDVPLRAAFGEPGVYLGDFIPTRVGDYSFHFTGTIGGQPVDERFDSGPGRFNSVEDTAELQFPVQQPSAQELQSSLQETQASVTEARDAASQARTFGLAGIGVGVLGLLAAGAALLSRRRGSAAAPVARSERVQE